jgi:hypothetical protein
MSDQFYDPAALPVGKDLQHTLNRKLGRPHSWPAHSREEKISNPCQKLNHISLVVQSGA